MTDFPRAKSGMRIAKKLLSDISQTFFIADVRLGFSIVLGLVIAAPRSALFGMIGALLSEGFGKLFSPNKKLELAGTIALNGFFVGLAAAYYFLGSGAVLGLLLGSFLSAGLSVVLPRILSPWQLPVLVLPDVVAVWCLWSMRFSAPLLQSRDFSAVPSQVQSSGLSELWMSFGYGEVLIGSVTGISQIFFLNEARLGSFVLMMLLVFNWRKGVCALLGSFLGSAAARALGAPILDVAHGYFGFGPALAILGFLSVVQGAGKNSLSRDNHVDKLIPLMICLLLTVVLTGSLGRNFAAMDLPALGLPYMVAVWSMYLIGPVANGRDHSWGSESGKW